MVKVPMVYFFAINGIITTNEYTSHPKPNTYQRRHCEERASGSEAAISHVMCTEAVGLLRRLQRFAKSLLAMTGAVASQIIWLEKGSKLKKCNWI